MIRVYLLILIIVLALLSLRWILKTPPAVVAGFLRKSAVYLLVALLLVLALLGKLNWLFALIGVLFAYLLRVLPVLLRYAPQLQRLLSMFFESRGKASSHNESGPAGAAMSRAQAYRILGLNPGASRQEIIVAHRKLIQKVHPDRGGSAYLASQLNQAKKILLET